MSETEPNYPIGLIYIKNFLTQDEHVDLLAFLQKSDGWKKAGRAARLVKQYGYEYPYSSAQKMSKLEEIPDNIKYIIRKLNELPELKDFHPDQAIINKYDVNQGISPHIDHTEKFGDIVVSLSIGASATMLFKKDAKSYRLTVPGRSLYIMTGDSRYLWTHEMVKSKSQVNVRYSITFRKVNENLIG